jgi:hypothetical protein
MVEAGIGLYDDQWKRNRERYLTKWRQ